MKSSHLTFAFFLFFLFSVMFVMAQKQTTNKNTSEDSSYFSAAVNYISDAVFMGRRDSVSAPYLYPSLTYYNKSGFYASSSLSYLTKSDQSRVDLFLITAGYDFTAKKLNGDISATKYFFNDDSYNVISEVEADLTAMLVYGFDILNAGISSSIYFNKNGSSDFFLSSELSHDFVSSNSKFQISPTAGLYLGSQNFYEEYYTNNRLGSRGRGQGSGSGGQTQSITTVQIEESEKFNLMAIEFSLPMWYVENQFTISFSPMLVLPQSKATIIANETVIEEKLDETFYWIVGISYQL